MFDRRVRFLLLLSLWCGSWLLLVIWFEPHYAAPLTATLFAIVTQGIRHLRQWKWKSYRIGVFASRLIFILVIAGAFSSDTVNAPRRGWNLARARVASRLQASAQKNLIIVRYAPDHDVNHEWVYNAADMDAAKVVWARYIPGLDLKPLLDYYHDRSIWVVDADTVPPRLMPYSTDKTTQSSP
jgi:hypothetical protein